MNFLRRKCSFDLRQRAHLTLLLVPHPVVALGHRRSSSRQCNEDKTLRNHNLLIKLGLRTLLHFQQITCVSANQFPLPPLAWLLGRVSFIAASGRYVLLQHRLVLVLSWLFNYGYGLSHVAVDR